MNFHASIMQQYRTIYENKEELLRRAKQLDAEGKKPMDDRMSMETSIKNGASIFSVLKEAKVLKFSLENLPSDKQFSYDKIRAPFNSIFIEYDRPIGIYRGIKHIPDEIQGFLLSQKINTFLGGEVVMLQCLSFYTDLEFAEYYLNIHSKYGIYTAVRESCANHGAYCQCLELEIAKNACRQEGITEDTPILITAFPKESVSLQHGTEKKFCPVLEQLQDVGSIVAQTLATINNSQIEYVIPSPFTVKEYKGNSPITYNIIINTSNPQERSKPINTGTGTQHRYRYSVRGHFRKLENGKVVWINSHDRGVEHENKIDKTYVVPAPKSRIGSYWQFLKKYLTSLLKL